MYNLILVSYLFLYYHMEKIIIYFETIPSLHRSLILAGGLFFFWIIEGIVPFSRIPYKKLKHAGPNLFFTVMTGVVNIGLAFALVAASDYVSASQFGILHIFYSPTLFLPQYLPLLPSFHSVCQNEHSR